MVFRNISLIHKYEIIMHLVAITMSHQSMHLQRDGHGILRHLFQQIEGTVIMILSHELLHSRDIGLDA